MKTVILLGLFILPFQYGFSQDTAYKLMEEVLIKGTIHPKGRFIVTEKTGRYTDHKTGRPIGHFRIIYSVDSLSRQLVTIVTVESNKKDHVTIYYFNKGLLAQVATGTKKGTSSKIDNLFHYTVEDNRIDPKELEGLSEVSEKYDLLRTARNYVIAFKSDKSNKKTEHTSLENTNKE